MNEETINVATLSDKVKAARLQARDIIRLGMINRRFAKIYNLNQDLAGCKKQVEAEAKNLAIFTYERTKKLDEAHPDYENILKLTEETIKDRTELSQRITEDLNLCIAATEKNIADLEKEVADIEAGEKKVNIEEVNELSAQILAKI